MKAKQSAKANTAAQQRALKVESLIVTLTGVVLIIVGLTTAMREGAAHWLAVGVILNCIGVIVVSVGLALSLSPHLAGKRSGRQKQG